jgi:hypothetical protein
MAEPLCSQLGHWLLGLSVNRLLTFLTNQETKVNTTTIDGGFANDNTVNAKPTWTN